MNSRARLRRVNQRRGQANSRIKQVIRVLASSCQMAWNFTQVIFTARSVATYSKTEPTAHSAVKRLAIANGNAPGTLRPRQLYTDKAINKKIVKTGNQMSGEYEYGQVMSASLKRSLFLPMPL